MLRQFGLILVFLFGLSAAGIAASIPFPSGLVPFSSIYHIGGPDSDGNRLVEGKLADLSAFTGIENMAPGTAGQLFSDSFMELAPGQYFADVYVPRASELQGNFNALSLILLDPFNGLPFPGNFISLSRLEGVFTFKIGPIRGSIPGPPGSVQAILIDTVPPFQGLPLVSKIVPVSFPGHFTYVAPSAEPVPEPGAMALLTLAAAFAECSRSLSASAVNAH